MTALSLEPLPFTVDDGIDIVSVSRELSVYSEAPRRLIYNSFWSPDRSALLKEGEVFLERRSPCCGEWGGVEVLDPDEAEPFSFCHGCGARWVGKKALARGVDAHRLVCISDPQVRFLTEGESLREVLAAWWQPAVGPWEALLRASEERSLISHELDSFLEQYKVTEALPEELRCG